MAMTDAEKIEWFDKTMEWLDQWDSADNARTAIDESAEAATDLFLDVVDQYEKERGS